MLERWHLILRKECSSNAKNMAFNLKRGRNVPQMLERWHLILREECSSNARKIAFNVPAMLERRHLI